MYNTVMTTIYLIRHGEVENPNQVWYGRLPGFGLSEKGKREADETGRFLKDKQIHALYASPLLRARQSMEIINKHLALPEIITSEDLIEVKSAFQGTSIEELNKKNFDLFAKEIRKQDDESLEDIQKRMLTFLNNVHKKHPGKNIAATSHGDPLMIIKAHLENKPMTIASIRPGWYLNHGEVLKVQLDDKKKTIESVFIPQV